MIRRPPKFTLFPYAALSRSIGEGVIEVKATAGDNHLGGDDWDERVVKHLVQTFNAQSGIDLSKDRKSTRLNSSHANISYAVFCLKKKKIIYIYPLLHHI